MESAVGRVEATGRGEQTEDIGRRMGWKHGHGTDTISMPVTIWQGRIRKATEYVGDMGGHAVTRMEFPPFAQLKLSPFALREPLKLEILQTTYKSGRCVAHINMTHRVYGRS